jgi:hypothetical protein
MGRIEDLLFDDVKWTIRFMEVASGGIQGFGDSKSFIPVDAITQMTVANV